LVPLDKQIAERDHIEEGLICIFSVLEPCRTFSFRTEKGKPFVASARRKCLFQYFYFINRDFGLMHVKLQTWFPLLIQVYVNGHEWLARKLSRTESATPSGKCVSLDRGLNKSPKVLGSFLFAGLAPPAQSLCQKDQSTDGGSSEPGSNPRETEPEDHIRRGDDRLCFSKDLLSDEEDLLRGPARF